MKNNLYFLFLVFIGLQALGQKDDPVIGFIYSRECLTIHFTDTSSGVSGTIIEYLWNFGDGSVPSTSQSPDHTYADDGVFTVDFTITIDGVPWTTSKTVYAKKIIADFTVERNCLNVTFTNTSVWADSLSQAVWDFGDLNQLVINESFSDPIVHTYLVDGDYTVSLTVTSTIFGCESDSLKMVSIHQPVVFFIFEPTGNCGEFQFTDQTQVASGSLTYLWEFDDGGSDTVQNPIHTFVDPGDHEVTLIVTHESGCQSSYMDVVSFYKPNAQFSSEAACLGTQTCFFDASLPGSVPIEKWNWDFGNGNFSNSQNPCYTYGSPGTFIVTLLVEDENGCTDTFESDPPLTIDYPPEADFSAAIECFNNPTVFDNLSDSNNVEIASWYWDFDDLPSGSNTSGEFEPTHLFSQAGSFNVKLRVENIYGCADSVVIPVYVDTIPIAAFTCTDSIAIGVEFEITDNSSSNTGSAIVSRYWTFGDGTSALNPNPVTHTYNDTATYQICLQVTNLNGCAHNYCQEIVVTPLPYVDFNYSVNAEILQVNFMDDSYTEVSIDSWLWNFGDPTTTTDYSTLENPYYIYPSVGFYEVSLEIMDANNGKHDTTKTIYVGSAIIADFTGSDGCIGDSTKFYDESYSLVSADYYSLYWDFGDGDTALYYEKVDSIYHTYDMPGIYNVKFATTGLYNGTPSSDTIVKQITIFSPPEAEIDTLYLVACLHQPINFKDISVSMEGDTITSWYWDFGDGAISTLQNPSYIYDSIKEYQVVLTVETQNGCRNMDTVTSKISIAPDVDFDIMNACINSPACFIHTQADMEITEWLWNFNDPYITGNDTSSAELPCYVYTHIDIYKVTLVASSYGCDTKLEKSFIVYPIPYSEFTATPNYGQIQGKTQFTNESIYADYYLWDFGNGHTSNVKEPIEFYEFDSTYTVTLISFNEHCSDTSRHEVKVFFRGLYIPTAFSPNNPNEGIRRFEPKGVNLEQYLMRVYDQRGNLLWESDKLDENGSPLESWDGYYNGLLMQEGIYVWQAYGKFRDGTEWKGSDLQADNPQTHGTITLIR